MNPLSVLALGRMPYADALALQRALREDRIAGKIDSGEPEVIVKK